MSRQRPFPLYENTHTGNQTCDHMFTAIKPTGSSQNTSLLTDTDLPLTVRKNNC